MRDHLLPPSPNTKGPRQLETLVTRRAVTDKPRVTV